MLSEDGKTYTFEDRTFPVRWGVIRIEQAGDPPLFIATDLLEELKGRKLEVVDYVKERYPAAARFLKL